MFYIMTGNEYLLPCPYNAVAFGAKDQAKVFKDKDAASYWLKRASSFYDTFTWQIVEV